MGRYRPGPTPAPNADDVANAIVALMRSYGHTPEMLRAFDWEIIPDGGSQATLPALAALRRVWPGCLPRLARQWCGGEAPSVKLAKARRAAWWDEVAVMKIAHDLRDAHEGRVGRFRVRRA